jgi:hypothetical protein
MNANAGTVVIQVAFLPAAAVVSAITRQSDNSNQQSLIKRF